MILNFVRVVLQAYSYWGWGCSIAYSLLSQQTHLPPIPSSPRFVNPTLDYIRDVSPWVVSGTSECLSCSFSPRKTFQ